MKKHSRGEMKIIFQRVNRLIQLNLQREVQKITLEGISAVAMKAPEGKCEKSLWREYCLILP